MERKEFDHCLRENELIEAGIQDKAMAQELLAMAEHREQFWN